MANDRNDQARSKAEALFTQKKRGERAPEKVKRQRQEEVAASLDKSAKLKTQRLARDEEAAAAKKR